MKPFDLEKARAGEPLVMRNGGKAYFLRDLREVYTEKRDLEYLNYPLVVIRSVTGIWQLARYPKDFNYMLDGEEHEYDIVGMWG